MFYQIYLLKLNLIHVIHLTTENQHILVNQYKIIKMPTN
jgi:hypothetical protein